jgi:phage-related minor tail protein
MLENSLVRAIQTGKFSFEDLRRVALSVLSEIAAAAIRGGMDSILGGGGGQGGHGGLLSSIGSILGSVLGAPGRATGGPVSPGRAYRVGERGPELFVPTSSGRIETGGGRGATQVNLTIRVSDNGRGSAPDALQRSSRQVARAVRQALARAED